MQTLRDRLKAATQEIHDSVDGNASATGVFAEQPSTDDYAQFLLKTYGFMAPIENAIYDGPASSELSKRNLLGRPRSELIIKDLEDLKISTKNLPQMEFIPQLESVASCMGAAYVLEGSVMGGLMMGKSLKKKLGISNSYAGHFLLPDEEPKATVSAFHSFVEKLNNFTNESSEEEESIGAAVETFQAIDAWMRSS
jgi:heme oxygenase